MEGGPAIDGSLPRQGGSAGRAQGDGISSRRNAPVGALGGGHPTQVPFFGSMLQLQLAKGLQTPFLKTGITGQISPGTGGDTGVR